MFSLSAVNFIYQFFVVAMYIFLPLYLRHKDFSVTQIGLLMAISPMISIAAQPIWGFVSDKYQTIKKVIILLLFIGLIFVTGLFFFNQIVQIAILMLFMYFFITPIPSFLESLSVDYAMHHNINYGNIRLWTSIGFGIASIVLGRVTNIIGIDKLIYLMLLFGGISLLVIFQLNDKTSQVKATTIDHELLIKTFKNKEILTFLLIVFLISFPLRLADSIFSLFITALGGTENHVGIAWAIIAISEVPMMLLIGRMLKKYDHLQLICFGGFVYAIRWLLYSIFPNVQLILVFQLLQPFSFVLFFVSGLQYMSKIVPKELMATGQMLYFAIYTGVSGILGNTLGGFLMDQISGQFVYQLAAVITLLGTIYAYSVYKVKKTKTCLQDIKN